MHRYKANSKMKQTYTYERRKNHRLIARLSLILGCVLAFDSMGAANLGTVDTEIDPEFENALLRIDVSRGNCNKSGVKEDGGCIELNFPDGQTVFYRGTSEGGTELGHGSPLINDFVSSFNKVLEQSNVKPRLSFTSDATNVREFYRKLASIEKNDSYFVGKISPEDYVISLSDCTGEADGFCISRFASIHNSQEMQKSLTDKKRLEKAKKEHLELTQNIEASTKQLVETLNGIQNDINNLKKPETSIVDESNLNNIWPISILSLLLLLFIVNWRHTRKTLEIYFSKIDKKYNPSESLDTNTLSKLVSDSHEAGIQKLLQQLQVLKEQNGDLEKRQNAILNQAGSDKNIDQLNNKLIAIERLLESKAENAVEPDHAVISELNVIKAGIQNQRAKLDSISAEIRDNLSIELSNLKRQDMQSIKAELSLASQHSADQLEQSHKQLTDEIKGVYQSFSSDLLIELTQSLSALGNLKGDLSDGLLFENQKLIEHWDSHKQTYDHSLTTQAEQIKQRVHDYCVENEESTSKMLNEASKVVIESNRKIGSTIQNLISGLDTQAQIQDIKSLPLYKLAQESGVDIRDLLKSAAAPLHGLYDSNVSNIRRILQSLQNDHTNEFSQYCAYVLTHANLDQLIDKTHLLSADYSLVNIWLKKDQNQFIDVWTKGYGDKNIVLSTWMRIKFLLTHLVCPAADDLHHQVFELKHHVSQIADLIRIGAGELGVQIHDLSQNMSSLTNEFYTTSSGEPILMNMIAEEPKFSRFLYDILETKPSDAVIDVEIWGFSQQGGSDYFAGKRSVLIRKSNLI